MNVIYKYPLVPGRNEVQVQEWADFLHVGDQSGIPTVWASVEETEALETVVFHVVPTGGKVPEEGEYVGTAVGPQFVWHVYKE